MTLVADRHVARAVRQIKKRADDQADPRDIADRFVETGLVQDLEKDSDQILFGRRGTGKTHLLRFLAERWQDRDQACVVAIDGRKIGSSGRYKDAGRPLHDRCLALFYDVFEIIVNGLNACMGSFPSGEAREVLLQHKQLIENVFDAYEELIKEKVSDRSVVEREEGSTVEALIGLSSASLSHEGDSRSRKLIEHGETARVSESDKIVFPAVANVLQDLLEGADGYLYVLIDEWSDIPWNLQPYLADFFRHTLVPCNRAFLKIAALGYRTHIYLQDPEYPVGLQVGADIEEARDLDDYYALELTPSEQDRIFGQLLFKHVRAELKGFGSGDVLRNQNIHKSSDFLRAICDTHVFRELILAAEGNPRDLIYIFCDAFNEAHLSRQQLIRLPDIVAKAQHHSLKRKLPNLTKAGKKFMEDLRQLMLDEGTGRTLLIREGLETAPLIAEIVHERILHVLDRGVTLRGDGRLFCRMEVDYGMLLAFEEHAHEELLSKMADGERILGEAVEECLKKLN